MKRYCADSLQALPGIGPAMAKDLCLLGINTPDELTGGNPRQLYDALCEITGQRQDRCVLYAFRCAVWVAENPGHPDKACTTGGPGKTKLVMSKEYTVQDTLPSGIEVLFVAGFGPIVTDQKASERLYRDLLRLPLESVEGYDGYLHTGRVEGVKHFALWPLDKVAQSCFGSDVWPEELPVPQSWLEVDVAGIEAATTILEKAGYRLLVRLQQEPWGQTVTRFLSPEGILMAVTHTPFLREE